MVQQLLVRGQVHGERARTLTVPLHLRADAIYILSACIDTECVDEYVVAYGVLLTVGLALG